MTLLKQGLGSIIAIAGALLTSSAWAGCDTRHGYNNSSVWWTISFDNGSTCSINGPNTPTCEVGPGQTVELHYEANILGPSDIILSDCVQPGVAKTVAKGCQTAKYHYNIGECYLFHDGNTYPFVLNDPASGDIQFIGPSKDGGSRRRSRKGVEARNPH